MYVQTQKHKTSFTYAVPNVLQTSCVPSVKEEFAFLINKTHKIKELLKKIHFIFTFRSIFDSRPSGNGKQKIYQETKIVLTRNKTSAFHSFKYLVQTCRFITKHSNNSVQKIGLLYSENETLETLKNNDDVLLFKVSF